MDAPSQEVFRVGWDFEQPGVLEGVSAMAVRLK